MALKLLTPSEIKSAKDAQTSRELWRAKETSEAVDVANNRLSKVERDFNQTVAKQQAFWAKQEEEHIQTLKERQEEINVLEHRRLQALVPLEIYQQKADNKMKEAEKLLEQVIQRESEVEELKELLNTRLDDIDDKDNTLAKQKVSLDKRQKGIEAQELITKNGSEQLSKQLADFHLWKTEEEGKIADKSKQLMLAEINFEAKLDKFARDKRALSELDIRLKDERGVLERGFAELKRNGIS